MSPIPEWQSAASDAHFSAPSECALRASKFERRIRYRNILEYAAGALGFVLFAGTAIGAFSKGETLIGLSALAIMAGVVVIMMGLHRRGSNLERRPEDNCLTHLRRQYERQHDALSSVPVWYVGPIMPGMVLFYLAVTAGVAEKIGWGAALAGVAGPAAISFGIVAVVLIANWWGARSLKAKIEGLDELA